MYTRCRRRRFMHSSHCSMSCEVHSCSTIESSTHILINISVGKAGTDVHVPVPICTSEAQRIWVSVGRIVCIASTSTIFPLGMFAFGLLWMNGGADKTQRMAMCLCHSENVERWCLTDIVFWNYLKQILRAKARDACRTVPVPGQIPIIFSEKMMMRLACGWEIYTQATRSRFNYLFLGFPCLGHAWMCRGQGGGSAICYICIQIHMCSITLSEMKWRSTFSYTIHPTHPNWASFFGSKLREIGISRWDVLNIHTRSERTDGRYFIKRIIQEMVWAELNAVSS